MSFRENQAQQMRMDDSFGGLTKREQRMLSKSWAAYFGEHIFPLIDEKPFSVLYSESAASRPNTPVNVIVGALHLKSMFDLTDEELLESLLFDVRYQYALHTTSFEEQPMSDRTLSRFRERLTAYYNETGIDLFHETIEALGVEYTKLMDIDERIKRMDSMSISGNCRRMGRLTLVYECVRQLAVAVHRLGCDAMLTDGLMDYVDKEKQTDPGYRLKEEAVRPLLVKYIADAYRLCLSCAGHEDLTALKEYERCARLLGEQTEISLEPEERIRIRQGKELRADDLQNPSDEDATYRVKGGKSDVGYVANLIEDVAEGGSGIITGYEVAPNITADTTFTENVLDDLGKREAPLTLVADGAYGSVELQERASEQNIDLVVTALSGKPVNAMVEQFVYDEDGRILKCPAGHAPYRTRVNEQSGACTARFDASVCAACPFKNQCPKSGNRKHEEVTITKKQRLRARTQARLDSGALDALKRIRNGVEALPSLLRRRHGVDHIPVRGLFYTSLWFGASVGALNALRVIRKVMKTARDAHLLLRFYRFLITKSRFIARVWIDRLPICDSHALLCA